MTQASNLSKRNGDRVENVNGRPAVPPRVDIYEGKEDLLLFADMPGVKSEDIELRVNAGELTLSGRRTSSGKGQNGGRSSEYDYRRSFLLPEGLDANKIEAELSAGVLRIRLPKAEAVKPRQIPVKSS
jgi:HSP20 family protein